jgi:hypothetical protein
MTTTSPMQRPHELGSATSVPGRFDTGGHISPVDTPMIASIPGVTPVAERISPDTLAKIVSFLLRLPNNTSVPEPVVNTRLESGL